MNGCNEWKREKRHECTNTELRPTQIMIAALGYVTSLSRVSEFQAARFLLDRQYLPTRVITRDCSNY